MSLFTLWPNTEIGSYEVVTVAEGIKTKRNAVLIGCSTEYPINVTNRAKCCNKILIAVDNKVEAIFNSESCVMVPTACRSTFTTKQNTGHHRICE